MILKYKLNNKILRRDDGFRRKIIEPSADVNGQRRWRVGEKEMPHACFTYNLVFPPVEQRHGGNNAKLGTHQLSATQSFPSGLQCNNHANRPLINLQCIYKFQQLHFLFVCMSHQQLIIEEDPLSLHKRPPHAGANHAR